MEPRRKQVFHTLVRGLRGMTDSRAFLAVRSIVANADPEHLARLEALDLADGETRWVGSKLCVHVRCAGCAGRMWTCLCAPHPECDTCSEPDPHPGYGTPFPDVPESERRYDGRFPIDRGRIEPPPLS